MKTITDKIDAVTGIPAEYKTGTPPAPKSVKIELTARCNFRCAFCATGSKLRDKRDMDWEFYSKRLLPMLKKAGVNEVGMFFLGESFLLDWLPEAIAEAKRQGFGYVFLTTNGALATPSMVAKCMQAGLDSLKFSLNYADKEQFNEIARVNDRAFGQMISNIKEASAVRDAGNYDCGLFASYIKYDGEQGERMKALLDSLEGCFDEVYSLPLYSQADLTGEDNEGRGWDVKAGNPGRAGNMREPLPCWALFTEARVTWNGHLSACCFDHDGRFDMGNLNEVDFMETWHSDNFQKLRQASLAKDVRGTACEGCAAYK